MAVRANLDAQLFPGRARRPPCAAGAVDLNLLVLRMNACFHEFTSVSKQRPRNGEYRRKILTDISERSGWSLRSAAACRRFERRCQGAALQRRPNCTRRVAPSRRREHI